MNGRYTKMDLTRVLEADFGDVSFGGARPFAQSTVRGGLAIACYVGRSWVNVHLVFRGALYDGVITGDDLAPLVAAVRAAIPALRVKVEKRSQKPWTVRLRARITKS